MKNSIPTKTLIIIIIVLIPFLLTQAAWIFRDAKNRGEKHYWFWGIFGLLNIPESLLIYLLVTRVILPRKRRNKKVS